MTAVQESDSMEPNEVRLLASNLEKTVKILSGAKEGEMSYHSAMTMLKDHQRWLAGETTPGALPGMLDRMMRAEERLVIIDQKLDEILGRLPDPLTDSGGSVKKPDSSPDGSLGTDGKWWMNIQAVGWFIVVLGGMSFLGADMKGIAALFSGIFKAFGGG